jgi:hypothetical protein
MAVKSNKPGFAALRRYAKGEGLDLNEEAKKQGGLYAALLRSFRGQVAELKALGVLPPTIDARSVTPNAYIGRVRNEFFDVLADKSKAKKVSKSAAKNLKSQGYTVRRNKVVVRKNETVRRGEVVPSSSPENLSNKYAIKRMSLRRDDDGEIDPDYMEKKVDEFLKGLGPNDYFSVEIYGNYGRVFNGSQREALMQYLSGQYGSANSKVSYIKRVYVGSREDAHAFNQEKEDAKIARKRQNERRRKARYRERKAKKTKK